MKGKTVKINICRFFTTEGYPHFKPICLKGLYASIKCHDNSDNCPQYKSSETADRRVTGIKPRPNKLKLL